MEKKNKSELLEIVENQSAKILAYRQKLHDVIEAYKGACKEKEAFENSLKAIRSSRPKVAMSGSQLDIAGISDNVTESEIDHPLALNEETPDEKVLMLSEALSTLTDEKNRIEACLTAEKKKLKQECDASVIKIEQMEEFHRIEIEKQQKTIQELKWNMGRQQKHQEDENKNHGLMLRELQSLLASERDTKEKLQNQCDRLKKQTELQRNVQKQSDEYEKLISDLRKELNSVQEKLKISEMVILKPSPLLIELKQEMADLKMDHQQVVEQEQKRANFAEDNLKSIASASEDRVTSLELRVSELSEMVGNYDRLRQQDQQTITKLKDRVAQLDLENTALTQAAGISDPIFHFSDDDSKLDVQALVEKIMRLKTLLITANDQSEYPIDLSDLFNLDNTEPESDIHSLCHQELEMLREEFESYKTRAQSVLKNKSVKQHDNSKELDFLHRQVSDLRARLQTAKSQIESSNEYHKKVEEKLQATIHELKTKYRQEVSTLESEHSAKLVELEQQVQKQRERTLTLLEEKEKELQLVKKNVLPHHFLQDPHLSDTQLDLDSDPEMKQQSASDSIADMLSQTMASKKGEQKILHYVQEIARKDVEVAHLRRAKHQAESDLRELQCVVVTKEEDLEMLESKVRRFKSSQNEEGINMEYLKNVILRYVLCKDIQGRKHMLNAIAAILHFTGRELDHARKNSVY